MKQNDTGKLIKDDTRIRHAVERAEKEREALGIQLRSADIHAAVERWKQKSPTHTQRSVAEQSYEVHEFIMLIKPAPEGGYLAHCPAVPDCYTRGTTPNEAQTKLIEKLTQRFSEASAKGMALSIEDVYLETIRIPVPAN